MIKAVIFDMDGLMIDSERVTYEEYVKKLSQLGYSFNEPTYRQCLGKNKQGICQVFYDNFGQVFPMKEVWDDVHVAIDERLEQEVPIKKGLTELLHYLKEHNYKTIVATSSARNRVDKILNNAGIYQFFDDIICGDEVTHGKPHPEIFLTACQKLNVDSQQAIVLEDSEAGIQAAYSGNIKVICVPDMKYPEPEFKKKTTLIVNSLDDVIPYLESIK